MKIRYLIIFCSLVFTVHSCEVNEIYKNEIVFFANRMWKEAHNNGSVICAQTYEFLMSLAHDSYVVEDYTPEIAAKFMEYALADQKGKIDDDKINVWISYIKSQESDVVK